MSDELNNTDPKVAELQSKIESMKAQVETAASIQRAFKSLQQFKPEVARYVHEASQGREPTPFWPTGPAAKASVETDYDELDTPAALKAMREELRIEREQMMQQVMGVVDQKFNAVSSPLMEMRTQNTLDKTRQSIDAEFGAGTFEKYREAASRLAEGPAGVVLQTPDGMATLMKAAIASDAHNNGLEAGKQTILSQARTANDIYGGPPPGGAKGANASLADGLDFDGDSAVADLAEFFARSDLSGATLALEE